MLLCARVSHRHRIGADENGLGAHLGPLVVTAVLARTTEDGERKVLGRPLPKRLRLDLGDSKDLVSHGDVALGEAWARAIVGDEAQSPAELFERFSSEAAPVLRQHCPSHVESQCWSAKNERFVAEQADVLRLRKHLENWAARGVEVQAVRTRILCTKRLNDGRTLGRNRFVSDLHCMEHLVLELREIAGSDVLAVCGKVGGMNDYSSFFGPLSDRLHAVLESGRKSSAYHFPGLGEVRFVRDADARDPLVMLASMVGKYVRELLMARVSKFHFDAHGDAELESVSGYHDPVTARFVKATALSRRKRDVPNDCFERARDPA